MMNLVDQYLLFRVRSRGDGEAFAKLYDRYVLQIYRFVYLKLPSKEQAEDVTSETFLKTWEFLLKNKDIRHFRALLYRIARNLVADAYRRKEPVASFEVVTNHPVFASSYSEGDVSDRQRGKQSIETRADFALLMQTISRLKEDYQDVLTLRLIDGLAFDDIAQVLEKSPGNVRVIFHRAMKALEQLMEAKQDV